MHESWRERTRLSALSTRPMCVYFHVSIHELCFDCFVYLHPSFVYVYLNSSSIHSLFVFTDLNSTHFRIRRTPRISDSSSIHSLFIFALWTRPRCEARIPRDCKPIRQPSFIHTLHPGYILHPRSIESKPLISNFTP